jgi:acetolactate synthase-1/2/3 large subunit
MRNGMPSFAELAKAYNLEGFRINSFNELEVLMNSINDSNKGMVIDVNVIENENCYPMVAPGRSNSQMLGLTKKK